jgi:hypothetical protein
MDQKSLDFYNKYKNCKWILPKIPDNLASTVEQASWILNQAKFGWIELDLTIDTVVWQAEAVASTDQFVPHREDENIGWNSACMHGIDVSSTGAWTNYGYTNEADVPYQWTTLADRTPVIKQFWTEQFPSDQYRRVRFMELTPDDAITPHSDMPGRLPGEDNFDALQFGIPINIAVIHPDQCYMVLEGYGVVPFKEGKAFIVNIRNRHSVLNFSSTPRVHVIGHSFGYGTKLEQFAELVVRSYSKQYDNQF